MEQLKAMIFQKIKQNNIQDEELQKLLFGLFKENAKTKQLNPLVWLYFNNTDFNDILKDIIIEAIANYYEDPQTAYKQTFKYVYKQYYKPQTTNRPLEQHENELLHEEDNHRRCSWNITHYYTKVEQKEYWNSITLRTYNNLQTHKKVFINGRQKQQTLNKLKKLNMI